MARLKSHGQELARVTKERTVDGTDRLCDRDVTIQTIHSDNKILERVKVRFRASQFSEAYWHDYGWKLKAKLKPEASPQSWLEHKVKWGWTIVHQNGIRTPVQEARQLSDEELLAILEARRAVVT